MSNARKGPHQSFNSYKEFTDKETDGQIVAATMEHLKMDTIEGNYTIKIKQSFKKACQFKYVYICFRFKLAFLSTYINK